MKQINKNLKKATNDYIEEKFHAQDLENMAKYDKKEKEKYDLLLKKKNEQMKIINEQMQEAKEKKMKEFQEKEIHLFFYLSLVFLSFYHTFFFLF